MRLSGTLLLPASAAPEAKVPAVVLVAGSGPTDRNGNQPPLLWTGFLKQTAEALAEGGIASLRYDKRGLNRSGKPPKDLKALADFVAWEYFVDDVVAAARAVREQPEVDTARVVLLGHSEGGLLVMHAAIAMQDAGCPPAAVVLVSTPGRSLDVVIREQLCGAFKRLGISAAATERLLRLNDEIIAEIRDHGTVPADVPPDLAPLYPRYAGRFLQSQFQLSPESLAARLTCPVLVIQGEKDLQVSAERDAPLLAAALKKRYGGARSDFVVLPGASHNLKHVDKPDSHSFFGPVVQEFRAKLVEWLAQNLK